MVFPPPPTTSIEWSSVGFKVREVNGHIESRYSPSLGRWSPPAFIRSPLIPIHGMSTCLNYGQQAFEGIKAFRTPSSEITVFRPYKNATRMAKSCDVLCVPPIPEEHFVACVNAAVAMNAEFVPPHETGAAMYVRPQVYGFGPQLGLNPPEEYVFSTFVMPTGTYHGADPIKALIMEDFDRAAPNGVGYAKLGGNYAPVYRWSEKAKRDGFGITLHLDSKTRTEIDEFSTSGFIGVEQVDGKTRLVVPDSPNVLRSVTSESTLDIAKGLGWETEYRSIKYAQLDNFKEVMAAGTAAALVPIQSITHRSSGKVFTFLPEGTKVPGPVFKKLLETLKAIQQGKIEGPAGWNHRVTATSLPTYETGEEMNVTAKIQPSPKAGGIDVDSGDADAVVG